MTDAATFDRRFLAFFALYVTTLGILYVFAVTFLVVPKDSQQYASTALGFILGTLLAAPLAYFYGASKQREPARPVPPVSTEEVKEKDDAKV
jgi:zinc transporter ZupT